jgi:hypothetical protein
MVRLAPDMAELIFCWAWEYMELKQSSVVYNRSGHVCVCVCGEMKLIFLGQVK